MWWICGLINVVVIILFACFFNRRIKKYDKWLMYDKVFFWSILILSFLSGFMGTLFFAGVLIYLIIDFFLYIKKGGF
jgi:uncharacterized membrane protein YbaN (DUF454 family)